MFALGPLLPARNKPDQACTEVGRNLMTTADDPLYDRMLGNLFSCLTRIAQGTDQASRARVPGAVVALFPAGPEAAFYNNAVLARGLDGSGAAEATTAIVSAYEGAGVERYAVWVHESEQTPIAEMTGRGFRVDTWTRAMAMSLDEIAVPFPEIDLGPSDWTEYLRIIGLPVGLLAGVDADDFHVLVARL